MNRMKPIGLIVIWIMISSVPVFAQAPDTLSDDDIYEMKTSAERTLQDYASAMRELINPRISKAYRERMINEFVTPGNRQIFVDSSYIVYDYEREHLPPLMIKERPVRTYLNDFNAFFQGEDSQDRLSIYYSIRTINDLEYDGENYYIILDFESQYGDQLPQPRRATMQLVERTGGWQALISYVKFNIESEDFDGEGPTVREALMPQWRIMAERADTLLQNGQFTEAKVLLDSSFAFNQEPLTARLLGLYFEEVDELDSAINSYERSISLGEEADPEYQDDVTQRKIEQLREEKQQLEEQQALEAQREEEARRNAPPRVNFADVNNSYKLGKEYLIQWGGTIYEPLTLQLFQNDRLVNTLQQDLSNSSFNWKVPESLPKGDNYQFKLIKPETEASVESGVFSIKRKTPLGIYVGASVGVAAALFFILQDDGGGNGNGNGNGGNGNGGGETEQNPFGDPPSPGTKN